MKTKVYIDRNYVYLILIELNTIIFDNGLIVNLDLHQEELTCAVSDSKNCTYRFSFKYIGKEVEINVLQQASCELGPPSILGKLQKQKCTAFLGDFAKFNNFI